MKKLGSVNPCSIAYLLNYQGVRIGETLDTPNAIACAMANNDEIYNSVSYYALFGESRKYRDELEDRFWFTKNDETLLSYLKIY